MKKKVMSFIAVILLVVSIIGTIPVSAHTPNDEEVFRGGTVSDEAHYFITYDYPMDDFYGMNTIDYTTSMTWYNEADINKYHQKNCQDMRLAKAHTLIIGYFNWRNKGIKYTGDDCSVLIDWYLGDPYEHEDATYNTKNNFTCYEYGELVGTKGASYPKNYGVYGITRTLYFTKYLKNYKKEGYATPYDMWKAETQIFRDYMDYQFAQIHKKLTEWFKVTINEDGFWYNYDEDTGKSIKTPIAKGSNERLQLLKKEFANSFKYTKAEKKLKNIKISNKKLKAIMPAVYRDKLTEGWNSLNQLVDGIKSSQWYGISEDRYQDIEEMLEWLECFEWEYRHIIEIADTIAKRNLDFNTWTNVQKAAKKMKTGVLQDKSDIIAICKAIKKLNK